MNNFQEEKSQTVDAYNNSAHQLAAKFDEIGVRISDIRETFQLVDKINPKILEIGCGNGRDTEEIIKETNDYLGIDISEGMIALAKRKVPNGRFEVADIENFFFPDGLDIIFAFASLLHVPKESLKEILAHSYAALNEGGAMRISLKHKDNYEKILKEDKFGKRMFYFYSQKDIEELAGKFIIVKNGLQELRGVQWLEVLLRK
ncbi:MAG: class I SAM-dependent methyltransferase [Patescibacteria group bacterium]|nr:class I SAM-dependent methyltransferase [Patescibacteria group bacterium]